MAPSYLTGRNARQYLEFEDERYCCLPSRPPAAILLPRGIAAREQPPQSPPPHSVRALSCRLPTRGSLRGGRMYNCCLPRWPNGNCS